MPIETGCDHDVVILEERGCRPALDRVAVPHRSQPVLYRGRMFRAHSDEYRHRRAVLMLNYAPEGQDALLRARNVAEERMTDAGGWELDL